MLKQNVLRVSISLLLERAIACLLRKGHIEELVMLLLRLVQLGVIALKVRVLPPHVRKASIIQKLVDIIYSTV